MGNISPLAALAALVVIGVTVEVVESQNKTAAYVLVLVILLGMITFNANAFRSQVETIIALLNAKSAPGKTSAAERPRPTTTGGGASFR